MLHSTLFLVLACSFGFFMAFEEIIVEEFTDEVMVVFFKRSLVGAVLRQYLHLYLVVGLFFAKQVQYFGTYRVNRKGFAGYRVKQQSGLTHCNILFQFHTLDFIRLQY